MIIDKILARGVFEEGNKESAIYMRYTYDFDDKTGSIIINLQTAKSDKFIGNSDEVSHNQKEIREYMCKRLLNELKVFLPNRNTTEPLVVIDATYEKLSIRPEAFRHIVAYENYNSDEDLVNNGCEELSEAVVILHNFYALYFSETESAILFAEIFKNEWESFVCYHNPLSKSFFISTNLFNSSIDNSLDNSRRIMISADLADQLRSAYKYRIGIILNKNSADFITDTNYQNGLGVSFMLMDADLAVLRDKVSRAVNQVHVNNAYIATLDRLIPADASSTSHSSASGYDSESSDDEDQSTAESDVSDQSDDEEQSITEPEASHLHYDAKRFLPPWAAVLSGTACVASTTNIERISGDEKPRRGYVSSDFFASPSKHSSAKQNNTNSSTTESEESDESEKSEVGNQLRPPRKQTKESFAARTEESEALEESDEDFRENGVSKAAAKALAKSSPPNVDNNKESKPGFILDNRHVSVAAQNSANPRVYKDKSKVVIMQLQNRVYGRIDRKLPYDQKQNYLNEIKSVIGPINDIEILSDIYHFINFEPNKKALNVHKNTLGDRVFFKNNTNSWQELIEVMRIQAFFVLLNNLGIANNGNDNFIDYKNISIDRNDHVTIPNAQNVFDILTHYLEDKLFCEHRSNNFFRNNFHATTAVKNLRNVISVCEAQIKRERHSVLVNS